MNKIKLNGEIVKLGEVTPTASGTGKYMLVHLDCPSKRGETEIHTKLSIFLFDKLVEDVSAQLKVGMNIELIGSLSSKYDAEKKFTKITLIGSGIKINVPEEF